MEPTPLVSAIVSFIFVIGLLLATLWFVRSRGIGFNPGGSGKIRVIHNHRLGAKHSLSIVEYDEKILLLGVAPQQITLLDSKSNVQGARAFEHLSDANAVAGADPEGAASPGGASGESKSSFAEHLKQFIQR